MKERSGQALAWSLLGFEMQEKSLMLAGLALKAKEIPAHDNDGHCRAPYGKIPAEAYDARQLGPAGHGRFLLMLLMLTELAL